MLHRAPGLCVRVRWLPNPARTSSMQEGAGEAGHWLMTAGRKESCVPNVSKRGSMPHGRTQTVLLYLHSAIQVPCGGVQPSLGAFA